MFNSLIDRFQAKFPANRLTALAMLVLAAPAAAAGGYIAVWVPKHFPGLPTFTPDQYTGFLITGAGVAALALITAGYKFIDGCQKDEANQAQLIEAGAARAHEHHMESMRLDTAERVAIAEQASSAGEAADTLGLPDQGNPRGAVGGVSPPPPPSEGAGFPDPPSEPSAPAEPVDPLPPPAPPVPQPPHEAAREAAQVSESPPPA